MKEDNFDSLDNSENDSMKWLYLPIIFILLFWLSYPLLLKFGGRLTSYFFPNLLSIAVSYGEFGDMYGAVNTLFTGLAFAVLIWTTRQQQKEIKIQAELLKLQHKESKEQTKHLEAVLKLKKALIGEASISSLRSEPSFRSFL